jgi:hypothetical protein
MADENPMPVPDDARPRIHVNPGAGEFSHQPEGANDPCVTPRAAAVCACGAYDLAWAP